MSVEEQNERIRRNQSSSVRDKRRSLNLSNNQNLDALKPSVNYRVVSIFVHSTFIFPVHWQWFAKHQVTYNSVKIFLISEGFFRFNSISTVIAFLQKMFMIYIYIIYIYMIIYLLLFIEVFGYLGCLICFCSSM